MLHCKIVPPRKYRMSSHLALRLDPHPVYSRLMYTLAHLEVMDRVVDLTGLMGWPQQPNPDVIIDLPGRMPTVGLVGRGSQIDRLGTYIKNVRALFSDWNFTGTTIPNVFNENSVDHKNMKGSIVLGDGSTSFLREEGDWPSSSARYYRGMCVGPSQAPYLNPTGTDAYSGTTGYMKNALPVLAAAVNSGAYDYWVGNTHYLHGSFAFTMSDYLLSSCSFYWGYEVWSGSSVTFNGWWIKLDCSVGYFPTTVPLDTEIWISSLVRMYFSYSISTMAYAYREDGGNTHRPWPAKVIAESTTYDCPSYLASETLESDMLEVIGVTQNGGFYQPLSNQAFLNFDRFAVDMQKDCYLANFFSTKDAVEKQLALLEANNVENLAQIGDLMGLVGSVRLLWSVFRFYKTKNFSFREAINLMTNAWLLYKFALAPSMKDASEIAEKASSLLSRIDDDQFDVRGKHTAWWEGEPFPHTRVTARTKLVGSLHWDTYLPYILPVDRLSLLPTLSRVWAVLPYSFLVDWFADIEGKLDVFDTVMRFRFVDASYLVQSITMDWEFSEDLLSAHGASRAVGTVSSADDFVGYRYFFRYIQAEMPVPTPSRLPLLTAGGIPDWKTAGSLLWQRLT